jgi:UDP-N-acetylglucosamine 2-epimerase (non-hydrolysing)
VVTGQHPRLDLAAFGLAAFPSFDLGCAGEADPHGHVRRVTAAMLPLLAHDPDLIIVQGDTSSALGGALAGAIANIPVAHVEAGLRTHDLALPWPEEEYRVAIDAQADLLFAPTALSAANLRAEKVGGEVHVTGNTGIDALLAAERSLSSRKVHDSAHPHILVTCHRRESWGDGLQSIAAALIELARSTPVTIEFVLHPNEHVATTMRHLLSGWPSIRLAQPCSHAELVRKVRDADLVLSDSGGIQEEAPALGTPLLVLRDKTERPEAIASGNARLVGTSTERIVGETRRLLEDPLAYACMAERSLPFGDGRSGPRIATIIEEWLMRSSPERRVQIRAAD